MSASRERRLQPAQVVLAMVVASLALRVLLSLQGGQAFWPDEQRYIRTGGLACAILDDGFSLARSRAILFNEDFSHWGFKLFSTPIQVLQGGLFRLVGSVETCEAILKGHSWFASVALQLISSMMILLVYGVARRFSASPREALLAAFFFACSQSMMYWSRHLVPYDIALVLMFFALWLGVRTDRSLVLVACGALISLACLVYQGYWITGALTAALLTGSTHLLQVPDSKRGLSRVGWRALMIVDGGLIPLIVVSLVRADFLAGLAKRAGKATSAIAHQGEFAEGWRLPIEYLWHAEHALLLVWAVCALLAVWLVVRRHPDTRRPAIYLGAIVFVYVGLLAGAFLEMFMVYGRLARQLVPFAALLSGSVVWILVDGSNASSALRRGAYAVLCAVLLLQAAVGFRAAFTIDFDPEIQRELVSELGSVAVGSTVVSVLRPRDEGERFILLNSGFMWPAVEHVAAPEGEVVRTFRGPYAFEPYLYENSTPQQRRTLRSPNARVRLIDRGTTQPR